MSVAVAIAQTTLALRDQLQAALRRDAGWTLTGAAARVTTLPHGKPDSGSGARMNLALLSVAPSRHLHIVAGSATTLASYDLRFLITAHVFVALHAEMIMGVALQAIYEEPFLGHAGDSDGDDDPVAAAVKRAVGRTRDIPARLAVEAVTELHHPDLRLPALIVTASPVVVDATAISSLLVAR